MATAKMELKKGDGATHYIKIPVSAWAAGGTLFFAAKSQPDDDATDAAAAIKKQFDDSVVTVDTTWATYTLAFDGTDTANISFSDGSSSKTYSGEFEWVPASGQPISYPGNDDYIQVIVYADINRRTT